jgi:hypothetical protein
MKILIAILLLLSSGDPAAADFEYRISDELPALIVEKYKGDPEARALVIEGVYSYELEGISPEFEFPETLTRLFIVENMKDSPEVNFNGIEKCNLGRAKISKEYSYCFSVGRSANFIYAAHYDGTARILRYVGNETEITIPDEIDGYVVTEIWSRALWSEQSNADSVTSVRIPETVRHIGYNAFNFPNLREIQGITAETRINGAAFADSPYTQDIRNAAEEFVIVGATLFDYKDVGKKETTVPKEVAVIGRLAFFNSSLEKIYIPDSVRRIEKGAFLASKAEIIYQDKGIIVFE